MKFLISNTKMKVSVGAIVIGSFVAVFVVSMIVVVLWSKYKEKFGGGHGGGGHGHGGGGHGHGGGHWGRGGGWGRGYGGYGYGYGGYPYGTYIDTVLYSEPVGENNFCQINCMDEYKKCILLGKDKNVCSGRLGQCVTLC